MAGAPFDLFVRMCQAPTNTLTLGATTWPCRTVATHGQLRRPPPGTVPADRYGSAPATARARLDAPGGPRPSGPGPRPRQRTASDRTRASTTAGQPRRAPGSLDAADPALDRPSPQS